MTTIFYEEQIPEKVKSLFKTNPDYVITTSSVYADGNGFNRESISLSKALPSVSGYNTRITLSAAQADKLVKAKRKFEKAKEDYEVLLRETQSALLALKTEKNVRENLPEAVPFLPPPMSNSLVVNFKSLQDRLNKQPDAKETVSI